MKMLELLNKLLSKLPANGYKSIIGGLVSFIYILFPDFPKSEIGDLANLLTQVIGVSGQVYLALGVIHKYVKAKLK